MGRFRKDRSGSPVPPPPPGAPPPAAAAPAARKPRPVLVGGAGGTDDTREQEIEVVRSPTEDSEQRWGRGSPRMAAAAAAGTAAGPEKGGRRRRSAGARWCILALSAVLVVAIGVTIALYFTGNLFADGGSGSGGEGAAATGEWFEVTDDFGGGGDGTGGGGGAGGSGSGLGDGMEGPGDPPPPPPTASPTAAPDPPRDAVPRDCDPATSGLSRPLHLFPTEGDGVTRIAFGSCFKPADQISSLLWEDVRNFRPDLFVWLGDNAYSRGTNMETKRRNYNLAREDRHYSSYGPVAEPRIPVTGTWDDNDFGDSGMGAEYQCLRSSQNEFVYHMGVPPTDPRHPNQGEGQRSGVYSSHMFSRPDTGTNGVHMINLDARSHRSITLRSKGDCDGARSTMLGEEQWAWLEAEMLGRTSVIKVISSGIQVLPPTTRIREVEQHCAYDGPNRSFDQANVEMGEMMWFQGVVYESWAQIPQERTRLLRLAQRSINEGRTKKIVFLSGEQHWGELMAKKVPGDRIQGGAGAEQIMYEVTASGIDQRWIENIPNSNRLRVRTADTRRNGVYDQECKFPFVLNGYIYNDCANVFGSGQPACSTQNTDRNVNIDGQWGNCLPESEELVPRDRQSHSLENKCSNAAHHVCEAQANYGTMVVDWENETVTMNVRTPHHTNSIASEMVIDL